MSNGKQIKPKFISNRLLSTYIKLDRSEWTCFYGRKKAEISLYHNIHIKPKGVIDDWMRVIVSSIDDHGWIADFPYNTDENVGKGVFVKYVRELEMHPATESHFRKFFTDNNCTVGLLEQ